MGDFTIKILRQTLVANKKEGLSERFLFFSLSAHKLELVESGHQSLIRCTSQKFSDCCTPVLPVVEGVIVHIHPDEFIGEGNLHSAGMGHAVIDGGPTVVETVADTLLHDCIDLGALLRCEVLADHIAAQRKRKAGFSLEPFPHVGNFLKSLVGLGELSLMDDESDINGTGTDCIEDLIEGDDDMVELGAKEELRTQIGTRHESRDGDFL